MAAIEPIAYIESPYKEKFAIPRQPGLADAAKGKVRFTPKFNQPDLVRGLEHYSHIWLIFQFHQTLTQGWKPLVRPPRLGGNEKMGVLATRSTFRPNSLGMSVVKLEQIHYQNKQLFLTISALDLLDGTPVFDIKPYIPYADSITTATSSIATSAPENTLQVNFAQSVQQQLTILETQYPKLTQLITQVLAQDPRPAYKKSHTDDKEYGIALYDLNIKWRLTSLTEVTVIEISKI